MDATVISLNARVIESGVAPYVGGALGAHMLASVVDACDSNLQRLGVLLENGVPPSVASRLLRTAGYTRPDICAGCSAPVDRKQTAAIHLASKTVRHEGCV